ncbi:MAG: glycoside hydrolase domain-containing protein [Limisphaerales bacterium]
MALWQRALASVQIEGGTAAQRETFATAMYHALLDPRTYSDVNGLYTGADGKIHPTKILLIAPSSAAGTPSAASFRCSL